jgi:hypothetical protein
MPAAKASDRNIIARIAAAERWGRTTDRSTATAPARAGLRAKFAAEVDPDGTLPPAELERCVDHLMQAHMLRMSRLGVQARRKTRQAAGQPEANGDAPSTQRGSGGRHA